MSFVGQLRELMRGFLCGRGRVDRDVQVEEATVRITWGGSSCGSSAPSTPWPRAVLYRADKEIAFVEHIETEEGVAKMQRTKRTKTDQKRASDMGMYLIEGFEPVRVFGGDAAAQRAETYVIQRAHGARVEVLDDLTQDERIVVRAHAGLDDWNRGEDGVTYTHVVVRRARRE